MTFNWNKINITTQQRDHSLLMQRNCPICQSNHASTILTIDHFQFFSDSDEHTKQVSLTEQICNHCHAIYLNPCYSNKGFSILFAEAGQSYGSSTQRPNEQYDWIKERTTVAGKSLLDIGCGSGNFLKSLPNNINKIGIDIDAPSIATAQQNNPDITFICSAFEEINYQENVDIITMFHVLEHLQDPLKTLKRLHQLASENTAFIVEVPIIENGLTNDINGFFSAQHLTHFSRNSFKNILTLSGWHIQEWFEQTDYNGCRVLAKKAQPQTRLQLDLKQKYNLHRYLQNWYASIAAAENKLQQINCKRCIIWGGGMHLEFIYQISSLFDREIEFLIVDKDPQKQGTTWRGIEIHNPAIIEGLTLENMQFIVSSYGNQEAIRNALLQYNIASNNIITLYDSIKVY